MRVDINNNVCTEGNICVQNLNVYYGDNHVLKDININIPDKKITAIIEMLQ
jgi:ABC-type phosphate transport system ATPase subunit